jgi:serine/threonine-protein kinase
VLDRMTDKDLGRRYQSAEALIGDLEDALAIEAARTGRATGEATAVLRTLPDHAKRRLPLSMRRPIPVLALVALVIAGGAAAALLAREGVQRAERGTGQTAVPPPSDQYRTVSVSRTSAHDYDPLGGDGEHRSEAPLAVDRQLGTAWTTETYRGWNKAGVGLYVDAKPGVRAASLRVQTPTPGWRTTLYAASGEKPPDAIEGWTRVGGGTVRRERQAFDLSVRERFRYYLVWITRLPEGEQRVELSEVELFQRTRRR